MNRLLWLPLGGAILAAAGSPDLLSGQEPDLAASSLAGQIRAHVEEHGQMELALVALVQLARPASPEDLDALADTLVAMAIAFAESPDPLVRPRAHQVIQLLVAAATWEHPRGSPYQSAPERLLRLGLQLPREFGGRAVLAFPRVIDQVTAIEYASMIARENGPSASLAVIVLGEQLGPRGLARALELYRGRVVHDMLAARQLDELARMHGWDRDG